MIWVKSGLNKISDDRHDKIIIFTVGTPGPFAGAALGGAAATGLAAATGAGRGAAGARAGAAAAGLAGAPAGAMPVTLT